MRQLAAGRGRVRYWALVISVAVHAVALAVFTGLKLSARQADAAPTRSGLSMQMIEKAVESPTPKPKPKIKPIETRVEPETPQPKPLVADDVPMPEPQREMAEPVEPSPAFTEPAAHAVEFFGQKSMVQRICYVVDCSGSMYGQMYRVKEQLKESILKLNSQQAFTVLFFTEGRQIFMTGEGKLQAASVLAKSEALALIQRIRPSGSTDAAHAMDRAMQLRDAGGRAPEVIYFLTDGFDFDADGALEFVEKIETRRKMLAPGVVLHTIGFWPQENDRKMLDVLAAVTGGEFVEVK